MARPSFVAGYTSQMILHLTPLRGLALGVSPTEMAMQQHVRPFAAKQPAGG